MEENRLNHRVFKTWCIRVKQQLSKTGFENYFCDVGVEHISKDFTQQQVKRF